MKLLKRLSKPLAELLSYEIHKETAGGPRSGTVMMIVRYSK